MQQLKYSVGLFPLIGSVARKQTTGRPKQRSDEAVENIKQIITDPPKTSISNLSQHVDLSYGI
ncbi:hypothetical protein BDFB_015215 [Asbolus verrucosus]|uniref:Uncharacterized protein n=1 Tax=Asbolus verrucosus TaxID=1661398 RepID=A0A482VJF2_ASBVE|nr:hypothetical protein BDFB_015215 [Asbolus verrucosus]